jgi:O-antigen/teichoic acid export membrane protein
MSSPFIAAWRRFQGKSPFLSRVVLTAGANGALALLGLATGTLAARLLGPQGRGELAAIQTWPTFLATLAMLGLPEALVYHCARKPERAGRYLGSAIAIALLGSVPFMVLGYLAIPFFLSAQSAEIVRAARWYLLIVPVFALVGLPYHPLRGLNRFFVWNALRLLAPLAWLVVLLGALATGWTKPPGLAFAYLALLALLFVPVFVAVIRHVRGPFRPDVQDWSPLLRYGLPTLASTLPQMLNYRMDQLLMMAFLPAQPLGFYAVAVSWGGMVQPLVSALGTTLFPHVASQGDSALQARVLARAVRVGFSVSAGLGALLLALTPLGLPLLFGKAFEPAVPAALVLVVASAVAAFNGVAEDGLRGLGRPSAVLWAELAGVAVTAVALLTLLPRWGILGAALASLLGYSGVSAVLVRQVRRSRRGSGATFRSAGEEVRAAWNGLLSLVERRTR